MRTRRLGRTGLLVSEIGFGAWAIGGDWGTVDDAASLRTLHAAADQGITFFDTADVYGDGRSERLIGRLIRERSGERLIVATKTGRRAPTELRHYTRANFRDWVDRSRENLGMAQLDLVQLHSLPTDVYYHPEIFGILDEMLAEGAIANYGVSIERVEEGIKALEYPNVATIQVIYNMFRQRPAERLLPAAAAEGVGIIARVPLASGLLSGKFTSETAFEATDHRAYNRHGEAFDVGETFAGIDYERGLAAVEMLRGILPPGPHMSQHALRWILMNDAVSTVIPGGRSPAQVASNAGASDIPPLPPSVMRAVDRIYRAEIATDVHQRW